MPNNIFKAHILRFMVCVNKGDEDNEKALNRIKKYYILNFKNDLQNNFKIPRVNLLLTLLSQWNSKVSFSKKVGFVLHVLQLQNKRIKTTSTFSFVVKKKYIYISSLSINQNLAVKK